MSSSTQTNISKDLKLIIRCTHCTNELVQEWGMLYPSWHCSEHGKVYGFFAGEVYLSDKKLSTV